MNTLLGMSNVYSLYNEYVDAPYSSPNYKGNSVKRGGNPKEIAKRRTKNKNKKTHRR